MCTLLLNAFSSLKQLASTEKSVMQKVRAVALVVGKEDIPAIPRDEDELRKWYIRVSNFWIVPLRVAG